MSKFNSVLWMNDDITNIKSILDLFKTNKLSCDIAIDSSEAIKFLENKEYDLIISNMSNVDSSGYRPIAGLLFLQRVIELDYEIPFILYCSKDEAQTNKDVAFELGAKSVIYSEEKLLKILGLGK